MRIFFGKPKGPSPEAVAALNEARQVSSRAEIIYAHREYLLQQNHFADRIRLIYEGDA